MTEPLARDAKGNELMEFVAGDESDLDGLDTSIPMPLALVVARQEKDLCLVFNRWRREWELPGGMIDAGETPRAAAVREFVEETGHAAPEVTFAGWALFRLMPEGRMEYAAVYTATIAKRQPFTANEEMERLMWWDGSEVSDVSAIDLKIAEMVSRG